MSDINQNDIDKLLQDALAGMGDDSPPSDTKSQPQDLGGPASQDDIDALFAAVGDVGAAAAPAAAPSPPADKKKETETVPDAGLDMNGVADQDDIDALFAAVGGASAAPAESGKDQPAPDANPDVDGIADQAGIDALFASVAGAEEKAAETETANQTDTVADMTGKDDIEAMLDHLDNQANAASDPGSAENTDLDSLLASIAEEAGRQEPVSTPETEPETEQRKPGQETALVNDTVMEELLRQVTDAAPPPPPPRPPQPEQYGRYGAKDLDTTVLPSEHVFKSVPPPAREPAPPPPAVSPPPAPRAVPPPPAADPDRNREFSVLHGAGEVESVANQISALIATLSEKAHRYMQAWMASDGEARELRGRALAEERRRASITSERDAFAGELDGLRSRVSELEGGKIALEESRRTLETSFQAKIRELESQVKLLDSEAESLKDELTRARNQATGVDIESRRARFEVDRLKNEVESERMERLRIQRALENREKEIQAVQAQAAGQASSLFIDELHRLVRRLETELEARSSGAHEALKQLDRLEASEDMVPVLANVRAAMMRAIGAETDGDDALKALGREASGVKGPAAVAPEKTDVISFDTALSTYNLSGAMDIAGTLLRGAKARPSTLMRKIYQCPALRRPEITDSIEDLSRLLDGLRTVQEAGDRSRGGETGESEVFYVRMFDFLHNLVRLKLINRLSGDVWRLFLDLRGRFSFVASDKQWAEYRDKTLNDNRSA